MGVVVVVDDGDLVVAEVLEGPRGGDRAVGREARAARERRDRCRRIRGLESLAVAALRISQPTQSNLDGRTGGELRSHLRMLSFYSPLHATAFPACPGSK